MATTIKKRARPRDEVDRAREGVDRAIGGIFVDGAKVVEVGTHEALMAKDGQYADLYQIQAAAYR